MPETPYEDVLVDQKYKWYLHDLGNYIREYIIWAKAEKERTRRTDGADYCAGQLMACNRIVSLMQQTAEGFQIPLEDICLDGIEPDRDLL